MASSPPLAPPPAGLDTTARAPRRVVVGMALAQFGLFVALLAPVTVSMAIKVQTLVPEDQRAIATGNVLSVAALFALVANPVFGRLSDLTTSRFGRRRPWMLGGVTVFVLALLVVAQAGSVGVVLAGWCLAQLAGNAVLAPMLATIADQVPAHQRAGVSANVGVMQNLGILLAAYVAQLFVSDVLALFLVPAALAFVLVVAYCAVLPDVVVRTRPALGGVRSLLTTFWVNPLRHRDFGLAWISRFLIILANFFFIVFRLFFLQDEIGLSTAEAAKTLTTGVLVNTVALVVTAKLGGWLSDRTGRRKPFVIASTVGFSVGLALLAATSTVSGFYWVELVMGASYGVYIAVDTALVIEVLPDPEDSAKDLGVLNIANALPQSLAGAIGGVLLGVGAAANDNYDLLFVVAGAVGVLGALAIVPIKGVR
ncbi:MFS transporter [Kineococcus sp. R8]|uniref:MFS transporter n=1 Tax=Kineococcus siccus TaxID=2696567 RepID=UPI00141350AF|nr:MFS transporter [Kineococcus siccus]NAZ81324.1 MFS transporter [Kineococcus siccus]